MKRNYSFIFIFIILGGVLVLPRSAASQGGTVLSIQPAVTELVPGQTGVVTVYVTDVENLFSFDVRVGFDTTQVTVSEESLTLGPLLEPGSILFDEVDEENGTVIFVMTRIGYETPPVYGSGVLFSFEVTAKNNIGEGTLVILEEDINPRLSTRDGEAIPHTLEHGMVRVLGAVADEYQTTSDKTLTVPQPGVLINDVLPFDETIVVELFQDIPIGEGSLEWSSEKDGGFNYLPGGWSGVTSFTYRACVEGGTCYESARVEIDVQKPGSENYIFMPLVLIP